MISTIRSTTGRHLAGTLGLAILMTATANAGQEALLKSVGDALTEVHATRDQLTPTMKSLKKLLSAKPGNDLRPKYQDYVSNVEKTKQAAATTKRRVDQMNADSANYFSGWAADNEKISNPQVRSSANHRLKQAQKDYASSLASLTAAANKFGPFLSDLNDIETAFSNDLTAKGLQAAQGAFPKAEADHAEVQKEIDIAAQHLAATKADLTPVAGQ